MQRHKIVAWIILLILSVINFVLGAPVLERGIREVRVDAVDVAEDVATASQKRWNPSDKWWTNSALADRTDAPQNLESSHSDYRSEQNLRPHDPRSPMDSNASPQPSMPVESPDLDNSHSLPVDSPPSAHNDLSLGIDSNAPPEPSPEPTGSSGSRSHSIDSPTDSDSSGYYLTYSTDSTTYSPHYPTGSKSPSSSPSHDTNPPPQHGNLDVPNAFYHHPHPVLDPPSPALSDPGPQWPYSPSDSGLPQSDQGPRKRPYSPPDSLVGLPQSGPASKRPSGSDPGPLSGPQSPSDSAQSTGTHAPPDPGQPTRPSDSGQPTGTHAPPGPGPSTPHPLSPAPLRQESENAISELFKDGRFKRRISGSRSVNAPRGGCGVLDSRESLPLHSFSRLPSNSPIHTHPDV